VVSERTTLSDAFCLVDDNIARTIHAVISFLQSGVLSPGHMGTAWAGVGEAENSAVAAVETALSDRLHGGQRVHDAARIFIDIAAEGDVPRVELEQALTRLQQVNRSAKIVYGSTVDSGLDRKRRATIIATKLA